MNKTNKLLTTFKKLPCGLWLFSKIICFKAPYFSTINPVFTQLEQGHGEAILRKRRSVQNHLGTVHAIAMANLCEFVAGTTLEITLPSSHRWIPKSMQINYLAKATTDVTAKTEIPRAEWLDAGTIQLNVDVTDNNNQTVVSAVIEMYVSKKKEKNE